MPPVQPLRNRLFLQYSLALSITVIRMLKGVDNSVGIAIDKGIDDANIYDHRRMMSQKRTGKGRSFPVSTQKSERSFLQRPFQKTTPRTSEKDQYSS
jgi:hypothetical protein